MTPINARPVPAPGVARPEKCPHCTNDRGLEQQGGPYWLCPVCAKTFT